ncbi:hypothetical protein PENTCL1PPCAC_20997, partial [Pristionchus entomophagus]
HRSFLFLLRSGQISVFGRLLVRQIDIDSGIGRRRLERRRECLLGCEVVHLSFDRIFLLRATFLAHN